MNKEQPGNDEMPLVLSPTSIRGVELRNRMLISPMCMYSAKDGMADDFHLVHLGRFALGGAGLVFVEATAVSEAGKITHGCLGLWKQEQIAPLARIAAFLKSAGAAAGIQLSHAGFKGATQRPWEGLGPLGDADIASRGEGPWPIQSVTGDPWDVGWVEPTQMSQQDIEQVVEDFASAAARADKAGFDVIEIHCAHGYLLHSFLSPLSNKRDDAYGGDLEGRMRLPLMVIEAVRKKLPDNKALFVRISSVDGLDVGWTVEESIAFAKRAKQHGVDVIDCSSGGMKLERHQNLLQREPGFHVPYAEAVKEQAEIATIAVGLIREPEMAEDILQSGKADFISVAREALFDPNWANHVALKLEGAAGWARWPEQFGWWLMRRARSQKDLYGPDRQADQ